MARRLPIKRLAGLAIALAIVAGPAPAPARAAGLELIGGSGLPGQEFLLVRGPPGTPVTIQERVGDRLLPIGAVTISWRGTGALYFAFKWRCDRRARHLLASGRAPDGSLVSDSWDTLTPSCKNRLALRFPSRVGGHTITGLLRDRWRIGARARLCTTPPSGTRRCRPVRIPGGAARKRVALHLRREGRWRVELRGTDQLLQRVLVVGRHGIRRLDRRRRPRVLAVGDSMMSPLDVLLMDRLGRRARIHPDVRVSSGLSRPRNGWIRHARFQARRLRPYATLIFLGTNDSVDMRTPSGERVTCCRLGWISEYARRAAALMRAYSWGGRGRVLWLTLPAPRSAVRLPYAWSVNSAARAAASTVPGATIIPLDEVFTPRFRYRAFMRWHGRRMRVRTTDGIHLTVAGSAIAERFVARALALPR